ncbi:MAG: hypothetical protein ABFS86_13570 [Planctomycetota bacterium]
MRSFRPNRRHAVPVCATLLVLPVLLAAAGAGTPIPPAGGEESFGDPTNITNSYFPVSPGGMRVYVGREGGQRVTIVETHLPETRVFEWAGQEVECLVVDQVTFVGGRKVERERRFFAQADDGTVWCFGETDDDEEGDVDEEDDPDEEDPGGWVVGQLAAGDPEDALTGARPTVWMPPAPVVGDTWVREELPPAFDEACETRAEGVAARTPAGRFPDCVKIRSESASDEEREAQWFAPGTGLVRVAGDGVRLRLQATTFHPAE